MKTRQSAPLPAILIGGPPHSGKSVLSYYLSQALRIRGLLHYLLRTAPDGEGDWLQEGEAARMQALRRKGRWTPDWVSIHRRYIAERKLPLLVDVGGRPSRDQLAIFAECTHAIVLAPDGPGREEWIRLIGEHNLSLMADLTSARAGETRFDLKEGVLVGVVTGLERGVHLDNWPGRLAFEMLVDAIAFVIGAPGDAAYAQLRDGMPQDAEFLDLNMLARELNPADPEHRFVDEDWREILSHIPNDRPLASYGRLTSWLAARLGVFRDVRWQFSARDGWVRVPQLSIAATGVEASATNHLLTFKIEPVNPDSIVLRVTFKPGIQMLDPLAVAAETLPAVPARKIIIDGRLPMWLTIGIARAYGSRPGSDPEGVTAPQAQDHSKP